MANNHIDKRTGKVRYKASELLEIEMYKQDIASREKRTKGFGPRKRVLEVYEDAKKKYGKDEAKLKAFEEANKIRKELIESIVNVWIEEYERENSSNKSNGRTQDDDDDAR